MDLALQQQLINQSPFAALFAGMVILGSVINYNATDSTVKPSESWCKNTTIDELASLDMPTGLGAVTLAVTLVFPLVPILLNSKTKKWNEFKIDIVKCHVVGSGSVFGVSELLRHFLTMPEPTFLQKCNITVDDCNFKSRFKNVPFSESSNASFCHPNIAVPTELFDSLHHFPDKTCCFIGASIVTFLSTLYFWNRINKKGKSIYDAHSFQKLTIILFQIVCVCLVLVYLYYLYTSFDDVQINGLFIGAILQFIIICSTLPKKENINDVELVTM